MLRPLTRLNSRKITNKKRAGDDTGSPRPAEPYGTAVRASTLRFNNSSAMNEGIELPQVSPSVVSFIHAGAHRGSRALTHGAQVESGASLATRSLGDPKVHPFGDIVDA